MLTDDEDFPNGEYEWPESFGQGRYDAFKEPTKTYSRDEPQLC